MSTSDFITRATKTQAKKSQIDEKQDIENPFCKYAKSKGCNPLKLIILRKKGFPDRTVLCPGGRLFFVEFKRPGKPSSPPQIIIRKTLERLGFEYYLCDQPGQAEIILDTFLAFEE